MNDLFERLGEHSHAHGRHSHSWCLCFYFLSIAATKVGRSVDVLIFEIPLVGYVNPADVIATAARVSSGNRSDISDSCASDISFLPNLLRNLDSHRTTPAFNHFDGHWQLHVAPTSPSFPQMQAISRAGLYSWRERREMTFTCTDHRKKGGGCITPMRNEVLYRRSVY